MHRIEFSETLSSHLPMSLVNDVMNNRTEHVVRALRESKVKTIVKMLDWMIAKKPNSSPIFIREIYYFLKYNSWEDSIHSRVDDLVETILGRKMEEATFDMSEGLEDALKTRNEELKIELNSLSESQKVAFFRPDATGKTPFHHYPACIEILDQVCPSKMRIKMFVKDKEGRTAIDYVFASAREHAEFIMTRARKQNLSSLFEHEVTLTQIIESCTADNVKKAVEVMTEEQMENEFFSEKEYLFYFFADPVMCLPRLKVFLENIPDKFKQRLLQEILDGENWEASERTTPLIHLMMSHYKK